MQQRAALRIALAAFLLLGCHADETMPTTTTTNPMFPGAISGVDASLVQEVGEAAQTAQSLNIPIPSDVLMPQLLFSLPPAQGTYVQGNIEANVFQINTAAFSNAHGNIQAMTPDGSYVAGLTSSQWVKLTIKPCSFLVPHIHPYGTETEYTLAGNVTAVLLPLQTPTADGTIPPPVSLVYGAPVGSLAIYPQGLLHTQLNTGCEDAVMLVNFNHVQGGTFQFFPPSQYAFPDSLLKALGYSAEQSASTKGATPMFGPLDPSGCACPPPAQP